MTVTRTDADRIAGLLLAGLGAFITATALEWDLMTDAGPGPGFFPLFYGIAMTVLSLGLVLQRFAGPSEGGDAPVAPEARRALAVWSILVGGILLLPVLGFPVVLGLLTLGVGFGVYRRPFGAVALAAVLVPAGFVVIFSLALGVDLPTGWLGF
ncbi:tripartite tricarboxylate transporter TctB family protein [Mongoliimonas terrestris]|uniref:tripartite tricarboxylate transporter TctB family protein n=1 Tax=Mongoliimonas terrestris TaxID=1709001 RepID=UPI0009495A9F|nr:tripartite tricarboxylate transporter TctB family protein [Mongoliimonas terrestris]